MQLETKRLILRPWEQADAEELYCLARDPKVGPAAGWMVHTSVENSCEIIRTVLCAPETYAVVLKQSGRIIGSIGLEPDRRREDVRSMEMGYSLAEESWGKGYMTEAACAVIDYAFRELGLAVLAICTGPENRRSQRVIEKCGFQYEGRQRKGYHIYDGTDRDNLMFSIIREEWEEDARD